MIRHGMVVRAAVIAVALTLVVDVVCTANQARTTGKIPITTSSDAAQQYFLKARVLFDKIRYPEALAMFEQAVAEDPDFALGHLFVAVLQSNTERKIAELDRAVALSEQASEGERLFILGVKAAFDGLPQKQGEYYQQMAAAYPDVERAQYWLATHFYRQQEYDRAIAGYEKAVQLEPAFFEAHNEMGYIYKILEDYPASERAFQKVIELIPDEANPYDSYAELLMKMGRFDSSIAVYRKALALNPDFVTTYVGIAANLMLLGEHEQARAEAQKLYDGAHNDGERRWALLVKAITYVDEGQPDAALTELEKRYAIGKTMGDPSSMADDLVVMGDVLLEAGRTDAAAGKYEQAATQIRESDLTPELKEAAERTYLFNAARVALAQGDLAAAKAGSDEFRDAAEAVNDPALIRLAHQLDGMIAFQQKDHEAAAEHLASADQNSPYNIYRLARAHTAQGNSAKAKELCAKAAQANLISSLDYAFVRAKALAMLADQ